MSPAPSRATRTSPPRTRPRAAGVSGEWWKAIYQVFFGEDQGPRFGSFAAIYGLANTRALIAKALSGALVEEHAAFVASRD